MRPLGIYRIDEPQVRDNFKALEEEFVDNPILNGQWKLFDREFTAAGTYRISHKLGFKPIDMIVTYQTATYTVNLSAATDEYLDIVITVQGRIRFILGRMK